MSDTVQGSRVGSQFGRYYLKRLIGRGGMGEVYEAEDTVKERVVALKVLSAALCQDPVFRERLQREARTAGRLQEPHVVPVHDYGEIDGQLFLDMRLIEGTDLSKLLKEHGALSPPRAVAIVHQIASALDAAHAAGVVHRDVKPENILITRDDFAYLVDFGIADAAADERLTQVGSAVGTWKYTAPERFTNSEVNHKVDIYALTCVLHECLTGVPPYRADSAGMLITAHLMEPIPHPSQLQPGVSGAFDEVIARGMAKDPQQRYASAGELALAAHEALSRSDQHRADVVLEHSEVATLPTADAQPPPTPIAPPPPPSVPMSHPPTGPSDHDRGSSGPLPRPMRSPPVGPTWAPASGPVHPPADGPRDAPSFAPGGNAWPGQFSTPPAVLPRRRVAPRKRKPRLLLGITAVAAVAVLGVLAIRLLNSSHPTPVEPSITGTTAAPTTTVSTMPAAEAQARLFGLLPAGYPAGTCKPIAPPKNALAKVSCDRNSDPDGPPSATYTLFPDRATLRFDFNRIVQSTTVIDCPGRIQSPGPWRHAATPKETAGMLLCGTHQGDPTVAWTTDAQLLVSVVQAKPREFAIDQLFTWWTFHS